MHKLKLIIKREYLAKVRNKSFVVMTFLSPILLVGMVMLIVFLTKVNDNETRVIMVLNESDYFSNAFHSSGNVSFVPYNAIDLESAKDSTLKMGIYGLLYIPQAETLEATANHATFYSKDNPVGSILDRVERIFQNRLQQGRLQDLGVSAKDFAAVSESFEVKTSTFEGARSLKGINEVKAVIGGLFGYLIMMFIIIYGGFVMRSVIEEKTSRIIEVIISSVKPFQLMLGKIIGTSLAGITQFVIWILSASFLLLVAMFLFDVDMAALRGASTEGNNPVMQMAPIPSSNFSDVQLYAQELMQIPWVLLISSFLLYFMMGYLIYSSIYAAIGAAVDNETDTQQFIFPIILPLMLAIYVGFFSVFSNPNGPIAVGFSLFPLTSPIVMLMRLPGGIGEGGVPLWQFLTSIILLLVTFLGIVWLAAKIYRVGILMYGKKPTYRELYKWLNY
ncbi:ABC-2 type exporter, permease component [Croceitalea dokdonensis DOKDO 023]|uniref:ABC-2 type exporter, permease component n=1 Tax=Croceitalea dokdonensis DOKDO 023 TaxID=1300341 RepID=A0A0P7ASB0_9FLAO|nr:ABC transporter permease [Croceitalea dokdonensis]KPM30749.1 ABC-2 type exporter, permease component [Croceitalea dokdonensis DOKDO 023]